MSGVIITGMEKVNKINAPLMNVKNYYKAIDNWVIPETIKEIKKNAPVGKTGRLEKNIFPGERGDDRIILVAMPYASHMEYGTKYFPVPDNIEAPMARTSTSGKPCYHPFIRPGVWSVMKKAKQKKIFFKVLFEK